MSTDLRGSVRNRLLTLMPDEDFERLAPYLEPVHLPAKYVVATADEPVTHAYFPNSGIGSIVAVSPTGRHAETGVFGRDGFAPTSHLTGSDRSLYTIFIQQPGDGCRIDSDTMGELVEASATLRLLLVRYLHTLASQTAYAALTNAIHHINERLARWLLMCHDRCDGDDLAITHDFLSLMLAVRRPSVTTALHVLEGMRLIIAHRGHIIIRDRKGLEEFAKDAYGKPEAEYARLIGPMN